MKLLQTLAIAASFYSSALSQYVASRYYDSPTGITYSSITLPNGVTYRIALPPLNSPTSDAIVQISAPNKFGWCALSWGGRMLNVPLSVAWPTKQSNAAIFSSRMASAYSIPSPYTGATYTPLALSPSKTNGTHWTATARCQGCTRWTAGGSTTNLDTKDGTTRFAYACSTGAVNQPASNTSSFPGHDSPGIWDHDLRIARNASFSKWVGGRAQVFVG